MDMKKLSPWNWFKKEDGQGGNQVAVAKESSTDLSHYHPIVRFHQDIDRLFNEMFRSFGFPVLPNLPALRSDTETMFGPGLSVLKPNLDIVEKADEYNISLEVPGVDEKDIQIKLEGNTLHIKGEKKQEKEEKEDNYHRIERSYGSFQRTLALPDDANIDHINASFKNGILLVKIGKNPETKPKGRTIEISQ